MKAKILIIRFSSFGDIAQCMSVSSHLKKHFEDCEIHFLTKNIFSDFVSLDPDIDHVHSFDTKTGIMGLWKLSVELKKQAYSHIYDAHNVMRTFVLWYFMSAYFGSFYIRRSKNRLRRFLLFFFKINTFEKPFRGSYSFFGPLKKWGLKDFSIESKDWKISKKDQNYIVMAPSAAWEMKRWPISHWKELVKKMDRPIKLLGGKDDLFLSEIAQENPEFCENLAGKTTLKETCEIIYNADLVVSGDTGVLHMADIMNKKSIALIGPTAFGFPSSKNVETLEVDLACRPCSKDGRGKCSQDIYQKCMVNIKVEQVLEKALSLTS